MSYKLTLINSCLARSGNSPVNVEDDGSDEWTVSSAGYESGVQYLLGGHDWKFATQTATLARFGDSPDADFDDAFAKPDNILGLVWVRVDDGDVDWKIVGNRILLSAGVGVVKAKYILEPDPEELPPLFTAALECLVKAACYEGLNEDAGEARSLRAEAEAKLSLAHTRSDREEKPRPVFRSTLLAARGVRRG